MKALIVDDSAVMRKVVERALRNIGLGSFDFVHAENGVSALEALSAGDGFSIILSDINMEEMDGLEFVEQVKARKLAAGVPIVMITTEGSKAHVMRALAAGARGYICKPFTIDQVKSSIAPLLGLS